MAKRGAGQRNQGVADCYRVHCPDILDVRLDAASGQRTHFIVDTDGAVLLPNGEHVRVDGQTAPEIERRIGTATGLSPVAVTVEIAQFRSQHIYLFGPGVGLQRAVPYQGPETVLDLLQRVGGIAPGTSPHDVFVVRPRVVEDRPPELYHIDLPAILLDNELQTNIRLQPFDQVFIGETRRASLQKCIPPLFRPIYEAVCGLDRSSKNEIRNPKEASNSKLQSEF